MVFSFSWLHNVLNDEEFSSFWQPLVIHLYTEVNTFPAHYQFGLVVNKFSVHHQNLINYDGHPTQFHENQTENRYMRANMTSLLFVFIQNDNQQSNVVVAKEVDGAIHVDINEELPLFPPDILVNLDEASMYLSILHKSKIIMRFLLTLPGIEKVEYVTGSQTDDVCLNNLRKCYRV
jgi:hypothetical protein